MKKLLLLTAVFMAGAGGVFAGGEAETGRSAAAEQVTEGQLLPVGAIDPGNYLSDFASDVSNTGSEPLVVRVDLLHDRVWEQGAQTAFRILLAVNEQSFFSSTPGLFVAFFQNPELLRDTAFVGELAVLVERYSGLDIRIFDPTAKVLYPVSNSGELMLAVSKLRNQQKIYDQNALIQRALDALSAADRRRSHLLWVSDENIAERPADLTFFNLAIELFAGAHTTFSYLAYGELPDWPSINEALMKRNGNSYYADSTAGIPAKIQKDLGFFHRPAVENIEVRIDLCRLVRENNSFYPYTYYGTLPGFGPRIFNNRPRSFHTLGGMNYGEVKRYIHYVYLPSLLDLIEAETPTPLLADRTLTVGRVFVRYYLPASDRWVYLQQDLKVEYVKADQAGAVRVDPNVKLDVIIQNTPLVLLEAAQMVNSNRNYLLALKLIQAQTALLSDLKAARPDEAIDEDLKMLHEYYTIVLDHAKAVNLLE
jgi:hypothetical protein